ncbi:MAG: glycosyltransferase family 2 protein [Planctomycetota bacterium]|jgi:GT2 family glycosyltransferase|nr:glycosyltransferase family 2 protein [Planctomycetota bacterium]
MTAQPPLVSIVLINFRMPEMTLGCVASIARHCRGPVEIIVVDNNSGDDSLEKLRESAVPFVTVPSPVNTGFSGGCNAGARAAMGKYIYLLNNDTLREDDSAGILADFLEKNPGAVAAGSGLRFPDGTPQRAAFLFPAPLRVFFGAEHVGEAVERRIPALRGALSMFIPEERVQKPCRVEWCSGASLMVRAEAYRAVGGFDEDFFVYAAEVEFCKRLVPYGETWFVPGTTVIHLEGASQPISDRRMGYMAAGRKLYYKKFHSFPYACLCNLADCGGALAKGIALRAAGLFSRNPKTRRRAMEQLTYAKNYFRYSYPFRAEE